jgi:hypothetical protein
MWIDRSAMETISYIRQGAHESGVRRVRTLGWPARASAGGVMAQIAVGAAIGAGFGLIRRRPLAILAWGGLPAIWQALAIALIAPAYMAMLGPIMRSGQAGAAPPDPSAIMPQMMMTSGLVQLVNIAQLLVAAVVYCAVFRAVLKPESSSYASLRLGGPELFLAVMIFAGGLALVFAMILLIIPVAIVVGLTAAATHGSAGGLGLAIVLFIVALIVIVMVLALRFAFVGPMMVEDGKFHLFESWRLTKGRLGSLVLIALGLLGVGLVIQVLFVALFFGVGAAALGAVTSGFRDLPALLQQPPTAILSKLAPFLGVYLVAYIPLAGCMTAIFGAPWAKAYSDLKPDVSESFA